MADKIQARAIRRCGELLRALAPKDTPGRPHGNGVGAHPISRKGAASGAGLSEHQRKTALRVSAVPGATFERLVEGDKPATVTALAKLGTKPRPLVDLQGRDPKEFAAATQAQGTIRDMAAFVRTADWAAILRGSFPREQRAMVAQARDIVRRLRKLIDDGTGDVPLPPCPVPETTP
jgi:hypothetical protein